MNRALILPAFFMPALVMAFHIAKTDFKLLAIEVQCPKNGFESPAQTAEIIEFGYVGEGKFSPSSPASIPSRPGEVRVVIGFPEDRFDWNKYTQKLPGTETKLVILNQISTSGENFSFLTQWMPRRDSMEFLRIYPGLFSMPVGEISFRGAPKSSAGGTLLLLQGIGSDAGINAQSFFALRLRGQDKLEKSRVIANKSEIPVADILARINEGQPAEVVVDSSLRCDLGKNVRGDVLKCSKTRTRILYTREGPQETPLGAEGFILDVPPFGRAGK